MKEVTRKIIKDFDLKPEAVEHWKNLPLRFRKRIYDATQSDMRAAVHWEVHHNFSGERPKKGPGSILAQAIDNAYDRYLKEEKEVK